MQKGLYRAIVCITIQHGINFSSIRKLIVVSQINGLFNKHEIS